MSSFPWRRLRDDRGEPIVAHWMDAATFRSLELETQHALKPILKSLRSRFGTHAGIAFLLVVPLVSGLALSWPLIILGGLFLGLVMAGIATFVDRPRVRVAVGRVLRQGLCGSCAFSLDTVEDVEGQLVCPECGASWSTHRVHLLDSSEPGRAHRRSRNKVRGALVDRSDENKQWQDERGNKVTLRFYSAAKCRDIEGDYARRVYRLWRSMRWSGAWIRGVLILAATGISIGAAVLVHTHMRAFFPGWHLAWMLILVMPVMAFFAGGGRQWLRFSNSAVRERICPCCWDDLEGVDAGDDGCVVCLECGAAWRGGT